MREFEIVAECEGLVHANVTVRLEVHESDTVSTRECTTDELSEYLKGNGDTSDSLNDTTWQNGNQWHDNAVHDDHGRSMRRVNSNTDHTNNHGDDKEDAKLPLRDLGVPPHETHVNILLKVIGMILGRQSFDKADHTAPRTLATRSNLVAVVHQNIRERRCVHCKVPEQIRQETGRKPWLRVLLILVDVECALVVEDERHIIVGTHVVKCMIVVDR